MGDDLINDWNVAVTRSAGPNGRMYQITDSENRYVVLSPEAVAKMLRALAPEIPDLMRMLETSDLVDDVIQKVIDSPPSQIRDTALTMLGVIKPK